jgi:hypothetical protein
MGCFRLERIGTAGDLHLAIPPPLPDQINVVLNWFELLKRRAPVVWRHESPFVGPFSPLHLF